MLTVIILTRDRIELLQAAIHSVNAQNVADLRTLILIDDCPKTQEYLKCHLPKQMQGNTITPIYCERSATDFSGPRRVAYLRKLGLSMVDTPLCAFLDDDNKFELGHVASLLSCLHKNKSPVAHSWRTIWTQKGEPYQFHVNDPGCKDEQLSIARLTSYISAGVYSVGTNIIKDQVVPKNRAISSVDTSEWIFDTSWIKDIGFDANYSPEDWETCHCEDSKLLDKIVELGISVPCTLQPTLRYNLGGYSNNIDAPGGKPQNWH